MRKRQWTQRKRQWTKLTYAPGSVSQEGLCLPLISCFQTNMRSLLPPVAVDPILGPRNTNEDPCGWWDNSDLEVPREQHPEASHGQVEKAQRSERDSLVFREFTT